MNKKDLVSLIDNIFKPLGFKRSNNQWTHEGDSIVKKIYIQKSSYGDIYYLNYGFDLKGLNYDGTSTHIPRGLTLKDGDGNSLLDFTNELDEDYRTNKIGNILQTVLLEEFNAINTIGDIQKDLNERPHNNEVPIKVKDFLGIS